MSPVSTVQLAGDHPRVCGEQMPICSRPRKTAGSPPRVRGTATSYCLYLHSNRITPACAGNSQTLYCQLEPAADHPRVCGEQHAYKAL